MKKKAIIAISALALCALAVSCKKADKTVTLIETAENNDAAKLLIEDDADVDAQDDDGMTALMFAAEK
ncbi:MAG: ankyrin repeat domain-containing protein, partial [Treponemataceae bacterium]|nr:ankyrin repeat domain-containing protein [Treponemataceae bacterium]